MRVEELRGSTASVDRPDLAHDALALRSSLGCTTAELKSLYGSKAERGSDGSLKRQTPRASCDGCEAILAPEETLDVATKRAAMDGAPGRFPT